MKLPFDEMLDAAGKARPHYEIFHKWLKEQSDTLMGLKRAEADLIFRRVGITFAVYGDEHFDTKGRRTFKYSLGKPSRKVVAAGYRALAAGMTV